MSGSQSQRILLETHDDGLYLDGVKVAKTPSVGLHVENYVGSIDRVVRETLRLAPDAFVRRCNECGSHFIGNPQESLCSAVCDTSSMQRTQATFAARHKRHRPMPG